MAHFSARKLRVALISAGYLHSGAITDCDSPSILLWGANPDHRLMQEDTESRLEPALTILEQVKAELERHSTQQSTTQNLSKNVEPY